MAYSFTLPLTNMTTHIESVGLEDCFACKRWVFRVYICWRMFYMYVYIYKYFRNHVQRHMLDQHKLIGTEQVGFAISVLINVGNVINHPYFDGLYHPFMVTFGVVYYYLMPQLVPLEAALLQHSPGHFTTTASPSAQEYDSYGYMQDVDEAIDELSLWYTQQ